MGTTGTVNGGLFQKRLGQDGIKTVVPDDTLQSTVMEAVYDIKNSRAQRSRADIRADLVAVADSLIAQKPEGAQGIIAGCTEIPLVLRQDDLSVPYFDAVEILARAAILKAGIEPLYQPS
jgi:aspartate racemase